MADVTEISVRWNNISRKAIIDSIIETTEDGRYSSMKNKKASWNSAVLIFNSKTGLNYSKKILVSQLQSMKKNWAVYDHYANCSGFGIDSTGIVTAAPEALNSYLVSHPKAAQFATTPLPFYKELCSLFSSK